MSNNLMESDDNNFDIKKYKFNPIFKNKHSQQITEKNENQIKNTDYNQNKKFQEYNVSPEYLSKPNNTIGTTSAVPTLNKPKNDLVSFNNKDKYLILLKQEEDMNILRNNYKEKISLLEQDYNKKLLKIEENNKLLIDNIKDLYNNKIKEINEQANQHLNKMNKQNLELLNELRMIRTNSIPLQEHYEKINDLNNKWEEKFKNFKKNYENKYKQISKKIETELPLDKVFEEINSSLTPENLIKTIKLIELRNKIGYYSFILNLQEKYNEDYEKFDEVNKEKIKNLKKYVNQRFDDIIKDKESDIIKNNDRKFSDNMKKSDIVNYDSFIDKSGINMEQNYGGNNNKNNNNNNNVSKSNSINQEKLSSDLESFNFNDDSIPNKDIQVLSPPDLIK